jgi:hypothetical protein
MRHKTYALCLFLCAFSAHAQFKKGNFQFGGAFGYRDNGLTGRPLNLTEYENKNWSVLPQAGYFVTDRVVVGLAAGYSRASVLQGQSNSREPQIVAPGGSVTIFDQRTHTTQGLFAFGPYARFHWPLGEKVALFAEVSAAYGFGNAQTSVNTNRTTLMFPTDASLPVMTTVESNQSEVNNSIRSWNVSVNPGLVFFPAPRWGIDLSLNVFGYTALRTKDDFNNTRTDDDLNLFANFTSLTIGARYYLNR